MDKEKINKVQGICIIILFLLSSGFILPLGAQAKEDIWIGISMGMVLCVGMVKVYSSIIGKYKNKSFFKIIETVFGKFIGSIINILYIWYAIHLCGLTLRDFGEFPTSTTLDSTPLVIFLMGITLLCIMAVKKGSDVIGKTAVIIVLLTAPIPVFTILILIPKMDILNIMPVLHSGTSNLMKSTLSTFTFPFAETLLCIALIEEIKDTKNVYTTFATGILIGGITLVSVTIAELLVIGHNIYSNTYFPIYVVASQANLGDYLERLEIITILATSLATFVKMSTLIYFTSKGVSTVLNIKKYSDIVSPIALLIFGVSYTVFPSVMGIIAWSTHIYPYYGLIFQVFLPLIILLGIYMKKNKRTNT